jgi:hypothetical protein
VQTGLVGGRILGATAVPRVRISHVPLGRMICSYEVAVGTKKEKQMEKYFFNHTHSRKCHKYVFNFFIS